MRYQEGKTYTLGELYEDMPISIRQLAQVVGVNEVTLARVRDGHPTRRFTANKLLQYFSQLYNGDFTLRNVEGFNILEYPKKRTESHIETPTPTIAITATPEPISYAVRPTRKKRSKPLSSKPQLPEDYAAWNTFLSNHGLPPSSFNKMDFCRAGEEYVLNGSVVRNALDYAGQDMLIRHARSLPRFNGRMHKCDVDVCPCHSLF